MSSRSGVGYLSPLLLCVFLLALIGLVNLYSATVGVQPVPFIENTLFRAQALYTLLGILVLIFASRLPSSWLHNLAPIVYIFSLVLLSLVLVMGLTVNGSLSWLDLGFVRLQPSEFAKLGLIFMLARHFGSLEMKGSLDLPSLIKPTAIFLLPTALVLLQKDLGTSLIFGLIFVAMLLLQGIRWPLLATALALTLIMGVVSYKFFMMPYQQKRIVSFLNPELDPKGSGYHLVQSKIAVGSGQVLGMGYLKGASNKLKFLPERHTDFIFPVLAEEWGFLGAAGTLLVYMLFLFSGVASATRANSRFGFFLAMGMVALFFWHMFVNLGGVLGLIPLTGVPLPFLSYGGSSLVTNWFAVGVLLAIYRSR